jgi:hypothetical protein
MRVGTIGQRMAFIGSSTPGGASGGLGIFDPDIADTPTAATGPADTTAIQDAIDAAAAAGGGIVRGPGLGTRIHLFPTLIANIGSDNYLNSACLVMRDNVELRDFAFVAGAGVGTGIRNDCRALLIANQHAKMHLANSGGRNVGFKITNVSLDGGTRIYDVIGSSGNTSWVAGDITALVIPGQAYRTIGAGGSPIVTNTVVSRTFNGGSNRTEILLSAAAPANGVIMLYTQDGVAVGLSVAGVTGTTFTVAGDQRAYFQPGWTFGLSGNDTTAANLQGFYVPTSVVYSAPNTIITVPSTSGATVSGTLVPAYPGLFLSDGAMFARADRWEANWAYMQGFGKYANWQWDAYDFISRGFYNNASDGNHTGGKTRGRVAAYGRALDNMAPAVSGNDYSRPGVNSTGDIDIVIEDVTLDPSLGMQFNPIRATGTAGTTINMLVERFHGEVTVGNAIEAIDDVGGNAMDISGAIINIHVVDMQTSVQGGNNLFRANAAGMKRLQIDHCTVLPSQSATASVISIDAAAARPLSMEYIKVGPIDNLVPTAGKIWSIGADVHVKQITVDSNVARLVGAGQALGINGAVGRVVLNNCSIISTSAGAASVVYQLSTANAITAVTGTTFVMTGDHRWKYPIGQQFRVNLNGTAAANGLYTVEAVAFGGGNTTITVDSTNGATVSGNINSHATVVLNDCNIVHEPTTGAIYATNIGGSLDLILNNTSIRTNSTSSILYGPSSNDSFVRIFGQGGIFSGFSNAGLAEILVGGITTYTWRVDHENFPVNLADTVPTPRLLVGSVHGDRLLNVAAFTPGATGVPPVGVMEFRRHSSTVGGWAPVDVFNTNPAAIAITSSQNLNANHQEIVITNAGAAGIAVAALPPALPGMRFRFRRSNAGQLFRIDPDAADVLEDVTLTTGVNRAAGVHIDITTDGGFITYFCESAGRWRAETYGNARANFT